MDDDDRRLRELFAQAPLPDDGFSARVVATIERRARLRRLLVPAALTAGALLAVVPLARLVTLAQDRLVTAANALPADAGLLPPGLLAGLLLASVAALAVTLLED